MATHLKGKWIDSSSIDASRLHLSNNSGLESDSTSALQIQLKSGGGIIRDSSGLSVQGTPLYTVVDQTSSVSLTSSDTGKLYTNTDCTALVNFNLPSPSVGVNYTFAVQNENGLRITAPAGTFLRIGTFDSTLGGYLETYTLGSAVQLMCIDSSKWLGLMVMNTWTVV